MMHFLRHAILSPLIFHAFVFFAAAMPRRAAASLMSTRDRCFTGHARQRDFSAVRFTLAASFFRQFLLFALPPFFLSLAMQQ